ncbi:polysaccharide pyruvyl transferase family protein [Salegentibacter sediminis]|uniref:polysaccharide pyruvyl transferase family protein n=1 Tax=Salegentibacter sediminis TaxID=1930251 RepID=UPI000DA22731|nr:polysaccharide pyruvyl transferase family protein [Salegentibacter sediminis]
MKNSPSIPLFYWSEIKFIFKEKENYGDLLSKYLVEKISGREVKFVHPRKQPWYKWDKSHYLAIGSILPHATKDSIVWGSGIIDREHHIASADFRAVRGPQTRKFLLDLGYECPPVYGDPAILLPEYFNPQVEKEYELGIIPHYHDYKKTVDLFGNNPDIRVIDLMCLDVEEVTRQIMSCERILSSSLHGLIVSHAYRIPSLWVEFSDKIFGDGIKYPDYLESVDMPVYEPPFIDEVCSKENLNSLFNDFPVLPEKEKIEALQQGLLEVCPFLLE